MPGGVIIGELLQDMATDKSGAKDGEYLEGNDLEEAKCYVIEKTNRAEWAYSRVRDTPASVRASIFLPFR